MGREARLACLDTIRGTKSNRGPIRMSCILTSSCPGPSETDATNSSETLPSASSARTHNECRIDLRVEWHLHHLADCRTWFRSHLWHSGHLVVRRFRPSGMRCLSKVLGGLRPILD